MNNEIGKIAKLLNEKEDVTPLQKRLFSLSKLLGGVTVVVCTIMFLLAVVEKRNILEMLISSISLAVAAIPEGLPAVVTIVLALGVQRMIKVKAIVRKLPSVETLGSVSIVCSDKTGTLTENKLTCDGIFENNKYHGSVRIESEKFKLTTALCNNAYKSNDEYIGSSIEVELLKILEKNNYNIIGSKRLEEKEFDSSRKMMSVLAEINGETRQYTKGAYDRIIDKCKYVLLNDRKVELTPSVKSYISGEIDYQANQAKRILAFAYREGVNSIEEKDLTFLGFITFIDPPRQGVKESIEKFKKAGRSS